MIRCSLDGRLRSPAGSRLLDEGVQTCRQQSLKVKVGTRKVDKSAASASADMATDVGMARDPAQDLTLQCEGQRLLKDVCIDPALHAVRQHSESSARFLRVLVQLARLKLEVASQDGSAGRDHEVFAAIEKRQATLSVGFRALNLEAISGLLKRAPGGEADSEKLLADLAREGEAARARAEAAESAMLSLGDITKLHEDAWRDSALERDQARQDQVTACELRLEGLRAKQRCLERSLQMSNVAIELPEVPTSGAIATQSDASAARTPVLNTSPLQEACACSTELIQSVRDMHDTCSDEVRTEILAIAARIAQEHSGRKDRLQLALGAVADEIRATRLALQAPATLHKRRCQAEALLDTLETLQAQVLAARREEREARNRAEDLLDSAPPGDPEVERAQNKLERVKAHGAALRLRRDGLMLEISALSAAPATVHGQVMGGSSHEESDETVKLDLPELPLRAQRLVQPFRAYEALKPADRARFDVEVLLRRAGLLTCERSYASYADLQVVVANKTNVKRATLLGAAPDAALKLLKEYGVSEFKRVKRAVAVASRLRHPGIVTVECASCLEMRVAHKRAHTHTHTHTHHAG